MSASQSRTATRLGSWAWMMAVQFYVAQLAVAAAWSSPFSLTERFISDLGNTVCAPYPMGSSNFVCSPEHWWMNLSFIALGVTMSIGAVGTRTLFVPGWKRDAAVALFVLAGLGVILVGIYPENEDRSRHILGAKFNFIAGNIALILFGLALPNAPRRASLKRFSIAAGSIGAAATALFGANIFLGIDVGGMERVAAYPMSIWQIVAGYAFFSSREQT